MRKLALGAGLLTIVAAGAIACGSSFNGTDPTTGDDGGGAAGDGSTTADGNPGDPLGNGGEGGAFKDSGPGGGGGEPGLDGGVLDGIFVSANSGHDDTGDGSMANPYKTIGKGLARGKSAAKAVLLCNETYLGESVTLLDGVSVYGNFDCSNLKAWKKSTTNAVLQAPQSPALIATSITKGTTFGYVDVQAPTPVTPALSSIGAVLSDVSGLELAHLKITTAAALPGKDGTNPAGLANDGTIEPAAGGAGGTNTCGGSATYSGGTGGAGAKYLETCTNASPMTPKHKTIDASKAGLTGSVGTGASGTSASAGAYSAPTGYVPGDGTTGTDGSGGSGGHGTVGLDFDPITDSDNIGTAMNKKYICECLEANHPGSCTLAGATGSGQTQSLSTGNGGAAGGCPGLAGSAGQGGGASIGIVSLGNPVTLTTVTIQTGDGGDGGKGTYGTAPTAGGSNGTTGTASGVSGSGAGGPSVCIVFNVPPIFSKGPEGAYATGKAGGGVAAIASGDGRTVPASGAGVAMPKLMVP